MSELIHGSTFTGFGMFDYAAMIAGIKTVWQIENNKFCNKLLEVRFPHAKRHGDIKTVRADELETVDIISGGFPCQPHSVAGKRKGREDERNLFPDSLRIFRAKKPKWLLLENVYGILNSDNGKFFEHDIVTPLEDEGYSVQPYIIPASAVGAVHRRDRLWIIANSGIIGRRGDSGQKPILQNKLRDNQSKTQEREGFTSNPFGCNNKNDSNSASFRLQGGGQKHG